MADITGRISGLTEATPSLTGRLGRAPGGSDISPAHNGRPPPARLRLGRGAPSEGNSEKLRAMCALGLFGTSAIRP